eukprot:252390_1
MSNSDEDWDKSVYALDYFVVIYSYVVLIMIVCIAVVLATKLRSNHNETKTTSQSETAGDAGAHENETDQPYHIKNITRMSIVAVFLYLLAALFCAIVLTKWILIDQEHGDALNSVLIDLAVVPYSINFFGVLFFILTQRLNRLLGSKCLHITSYVLPVVGFTLVMVVMTIIRHTIQKLGNMIKRYQISAIFATFLLIIYFVIGVVYLRQIAKIMTRRAEMNMNKRYNEMAHDAVDQSEQETEKPNLIKDEVIVTFGDVQDTVRCALLVMICAMSNFLSPISVFIAGQHRRHLDHRTTLFPFGVLTDSMINTVCLLLLFQFAENYYLCLCEPCHGCVLNCCANRVSNGFRKKDTKYSHEEYVSLIIPTSADVE